MAYCWVQTPGLLKRRKLNISPQRPLLRSHWVRQEKYECEATLTADGVQLAKDWTLLPPEVLAFIFGFLSSGKDRRSVQLVCRSWNGVMSLKSLWKNSYICIRKTAAVASASTALWLRLQARGITRFCISCIKESNLALFMKKLVDFAPKTVSLDLHFTESADLGRKDFLSAISQLHSLRKLGLSGKGSQYVLHMATLLASLPGLQELLLFAVPNVRLKSIRHEKLKVLVLEKMGCLKSSETCILLQELPCLEQLEIKACSYDRWCFNSSFQPGLGTDIVYSSGYDQDTKLVKLSLARSNFDESEVSFPRRLLFLQSLDLSSCRLDQEYLSDILGQLLYLKELKLSGNDCTDAVILKLRCPLESIELKMCHKVTARALRYLATSTKLTHLGLGHCCNIAASLLYVMHKLFPELEYLDLSGWPGLNSDYFMCLRKLSCLKTVVVLDVPRTQLPLRTIQNFRKHFNEQCSVVTPDWQCHFDQVL